MFAVALSASSPRPPLSNSASRKRVDADCWAVNPGILKATASPDPLRFTVGNFRRGRREHHQRQKRRLPNCG